MSKHCYSYNEELTSPLFFFQAEDGIRDTSVTGVQTCALPIFRRRDSGLGGVVRIRRAVFVCKSGRTETAKEIGRASCRERVEISVGGAWLLKEVEIELCGMTVARTGLCGSGVRCVDSIRRINW